MSLLDLITGASGNQVATQAENKFGVSKNQIIALLAVSAPLIISYLRKNSQNANDAEALNNALDKDHDGSILNDPAQAEARQNEGGSILNHVFGTDKTNVENQLSQGTGISMDKIGPILAMLAPLIMGYIGKQKQQNNVSAGGLGDLLGGLLGGNAQNTSNAQEANSLQDILGNVLGNNTAGNSASANPLNDLLGNVLGNKTGGDNSGLGGILGNLLGGK